MSIPSSVATPKRKNTRRGALTDVVIKQAKTRDKAYKLFDGGGMYLLIHPNGSKYWRCKFRLGGKEKLLSLSVYPEVSLTQARAARDAARKLIANGIDPIEHDRRKEIERQRLAANSLEANDKRSLWEKIKDAADNAWSATKRIAGESWDNPGEFGKGILKGIGNLAVMAVKQQMSIPQIARLLDRQAMQSYGAGDIAGANRYAGIARQMREMGQIGDLLELTNDAQQGGSFVSILFPVGTVAKGTVTLTKVVKGAGTLADAAKGAKEADVLADVGKGAAEATGKTATKGMGEAAAKGPGVFVKKISPSKDPRYARGNFRKGVREEVWEKAKGPDGKVRDPVTGKEMKYDEPWDMGHKPGHEHWKHQQSAAERGITRKEFLNEYNNTSNYRPELPSSNRSHAGELKSSDYFGP